MTSFTRTMFPRPFHHQPSNKPIPGQPRFGAIQKDDTFVEAINRQPGQLLLVSGPSGAGKGTVIKGILKDPKVQASISKVGSVTSREPRPGEVPQGMAKLRESFKALAEGVLDSLPRSWIPDSIRRWQNRPSPFQYTFVSKSQFEELKKSGQLFQDAFIDGNYYGSMVNEVVSKLKRGATVLFELRAPDALRLKKLYPNKVNTVFIAPPKPELEVLRERLEKRGTNSEESIRHRLEMAREELALRPKFDRVIVNKDIGKAVNELKDIVLGHFKKP